MRSYSFSQSACNTHNNASQGALQSRSIYALHEYRLDRLACLSVCGRSMLMEEDASSKNFRHFAHTGQITGPPCDVN